MMSEGAMMGNTPDFVIAKTLAELKREYQQYVDSAGPYFAAYFCYMYAELVDMPCEAVCDNEIYVDFIDQLRNLCPDWFYEISTGNTLEEKLTQIFLTSVGKPLSFYYCDRVSHLRVAVLDQLIEKFGEDYVFTVNVYVVPGADE